MRTPEETQRLLRDGDGDPARRAELVVLATCRRCGALAAARSALGAPDEPSRPRNAAELVALLDAAWSPDGASAAGCPSCGASATLLSRLGLRLVLPLAGSGAELLAERLSGDAHVSFFRAPLDGLERPLGDALDDDAIESAFGRPLSLAARVIPALDAAARGEERLDEIEPGSWLFAGPPRDGGLDARVSTLVERSSGTFVVPLATVAGETTLAAWLPAARAAAVAGAELRAGLAIDARALSRLIARALSLDGIGARIEPGRVIALRDGLEWPAELALLVSQGIAHGLLLPEIAAQAATELASRLDAIATWLRALAGALPGARLSASAGELRTELPDGVAGRPLDVSVCFLEPTTESVLRAARFVASEIPAFADPTRLCPCGAHALLETRVLPWPAIAAALGDEGAPAAQRSSGGALALTARWPDAETPRAASVVVIACDLHRRFATAEEIASVGFDDGALERRLARDLAERTTAVELFARGPAETPAIVVRGPGAASLFAHDGCLAALDAAVGSPLGRRAARALALPPDALGLADVGADAGPLRALVIAAGGGDERWVVERPVDLAIDPLGRVRLVERDATGTGGESGSPAPSRSR